MNPGDPTTVAMGNLNTAVTNTVGVMASTATFAQKCGDFIRTHSNDPAALQAFADQLTAGATALGNAVAANPLPGEVVTPTGGGTGTPTGGATTHRSGRP